MLNDLWKIHVTLDFHINRRTADAGVIREVEICFPEFYFLDSALVYTYVVPSA